MLRFYTIEKDETGEWDIFKTTSLSTTVAEKLSEDNPISVCKRTFSDKPLFVVYANTASDAMKKFEQYIRLPNFVYKGK